MHCITLIFIRVLHNLVLFNFSLKFPSSNNLLHLQEKLRQDAIKQAEKERRDKYKKMEDDREGIRQGIRDKVST